MKFYGRQKERTLLEQQFALTVDSSVMTVITGRRRIGKTYLARKHAEGKKSIYLFVSKKPEVLLCKEFTETIRAVIDYPVIGDITEFKQVFRLLMEISKTEQIVLIIDEFQEFYTINQSVYSDIQNLWDEYKDQTKAQVLFIGSVYSLMHKIFQNSKEPLFGRADRIMYLKPFPPSVIKEILDDNHTYTKENLLHIYMITGGIPKYLNTLTQYNTCSMADILDLYLQDSSPFLEEGKMILVEEFGKEYGTYFAILQMLSEGRTSRSEIESILERNIGGYLEKLETDYDLIRKRKPVSAKATGKVQKYYIKDNFLSFWFRFIFRNKSAIESNNYDFIRKSIEMNIQNYSGQVLEKLYHDIFIEKSSFNQIGNYWERGNKNELDLVAINDLEKRIVISEVKMNVDKARLNALKEKSINLIKKYPGYEVEYLLLGMQTLDKYLMKKTL
ncbi:MAG: ATP-binding protein [Spirochaetales bacterium]|nr:ATP-binding protein [Spirochaetales bacterium]